jgi:hypothetical protein
MDRVRLPKGGAKGNDYTRFISDVQGELSGEIWLLNPNKLNPFCLTYLIGDDSLSR